MTRTAVLADDLTGANDTAVQFANDGWLTYSLLSDIVPSGALDSDLVAVARSLGTRALPDREAREVTRAAMANALADGFERAYLKVDSTVRGSVAAQVAGALAAMPGAAAVVCPAYPALGRTVEDGNVMVDGVPVDETPIGNDPVTPVTTADLTVIIPGASGVVTLPVERSAGAVYVVDARTEDDLAELARQIAQDPNLLPVGSAGLARHLSREWSRKGGGGAVADPLRAARVVIMASSLNPVSREQVDRVVAHAGGVLHEFGEAQLVSAEVIDTWAAGLGSDRPAISIVRSLGERGASSERAVTATEVAAGLARASSALIDGDPTVAVLVLGGDGAAALLTLIGAVALKVEGLLSEGVPVGRVTGGRLEGLAVVTKAGGFGRPETIREICSGILEEKE